MLKRFQLLLLLGTISAVMHGIVLWCFLIVHYTPLLQLHTLNKDLEFIIMPLVKSVPNAVPLMQQKTVTQTPSVKKSAPVSPPKKIENVPSSPQKNNAKPAVQKKAAAKPVPEKKAPVKKELPKKPEPKKVEEKKVEPIKKNLEKAPEKAQAAPMLASEEKKLPAVIALGSQDAQLVTTLCQIEQALNHAWQGPCVHPAGPRLRCKVTIDHQGKASQVDVEHHCNAILYEAAAVNALSSIVFPRVLYNSTQSIEF